MEMMNPKMNNILLHKIKLTLAYQILRRLLVHIINSQMVSMLTIFIDSSKSIPKRVFSFILKVMIVLIIRL